MSTSRLSNVEDRGKRSRTATADGPTPVSAEPWPRSPSKFDLPSSWAHLTPKQIIRLPEFHDHLRNNNWDRFDSLYYNGMLDVKMEPTRFLCESTLRRLGLKQQMTQMLSNLGLGTMATRYYPLYPDLARQFIATCHVAYSGSGRQNVQNGRLRFKVNGLCYSLSFTDICDCFGFDAAQTRITLPEAYPDSQVIWDEIAKDVYKASTSVQKDIRHPVLRMFAKTLGNTLLCVMENNKMRLKHLILLAYAVGDRWGDRLEDYMIENKINLGALFAYHLEELKEKALSPQGKIESIGSLITPLLQHAEVALPTDGNGVVTRASYVDEDHLRRGNHIKPAGTSQRGVQQWCYEFLSSEGRPLFVKLPTPYAAIDTLEDLRFMVPPADLYTHSARHSRTSVRGSSSRGGASAAADDDEDVPAYQPLGAYPRASEEVLHDTIAFRRHQESTLERLWNYIRCTRVRDDVAPSTSASRRTARAFRESSDESEEF